MRWPTMMLPLSRPERAEPVNYNDAATGVVWSDVMGDRPDLDDCQPSYPEVHVGD